MPLSRRQKRRLFSLPLGLGIGLVFGLLGILGVFESYELQSLDFRFKLRGERPLSKSICMVVVDNQTLKTLGWPVRRSMYANLIAVAKKHGARVVGFDILFSDPGIGGPEDDRLFAEAAALVGNVVFPAEFSFSTVGKSGVLEAAGATMPLPALAEAAAGIAHVHLDNLDDGVFRRVPLFVHHAGKQVPAISLLLAAQYLRKDPEDFVFTQDRPFINYRTTGEGIEAVRLFDLLKAHRDALQGKTPETDLKAFFHDKLVLVGQTAASVGDHGPVPLSSNAPLVLAHANFIDNLLSGDFLVRAPAWLNFLMVVLLCAILGFAVGHLRALTGVTAALAGLIAFALMTFFLFAGSSYWIDLITPTAAVVFVCLGVMVYNHFVRDVDERLVKKAFESYVSPHMMDRILENPGTLDISGDRKQLSILFSDIKGYTTLSQSLPPSAIVDLLREYLEAMTRVLFEHGGTVDKIMGDGIMAFFGDPVPQEDHALRAVRTAMAMQAELNKMQRTWIAEGKAGLQVRIGIATGDVYVGNIGSKHHIEYTAIGRTVNLAARLESKAPPGGILISRETFDKVKDYFDCEEVPGLQLKGYRQAYRAYWVFGQRAPGAVQADWAKTQKKEERRENPRVELMTVVKYEYGGREYFGQAINASRDGMFIATENPPEVGTEITVVGEVHAEEELLPVEIYGVVRRVVDNDEGKGMGVQFDRIIADQAETIRYFLRNVFGLQDLSTTTIAVGLDDQDHPLFRYDFAKVIEKGEPPKKT
jgi:adenylate cyclase